MRQGSAGPLGVGILTVSDRLSRGEGEDVSGATIREWCEDRGYEVRRAAVVSDGTSAVVPVLLDWADCGEVELLLPTGGTGLTPRDCTPEATRAVIEREAPGLAELLRLRGLEHTPHAMLTRGVAGIAGQTLIVNLPGSPRAVREGLDTLLPVLPHALETLRGRSSECARPAPDSEGRDA